MEVLTAQGPPVGRSRGTIRATAGRRGAQSLRQGMKLKPSFKKSWSVYIVRCGNGALYTGITNRLAGRIADHNSGRGAKYTAAFGPVALVWHKKSRTRSSASKLEARIKKMSRQEKEELAAANSSSVK